MHNGDDMILKKIEELNGNEILGRALMTWDYQIILQEGAILREEYIEKIKELDINEVWIMEEETSPNEIVILKSDIESSIKEKVRDILERHTYQNNQELSELSKTADSIIATILEEEQVVEKVFDIKQRSADLYEHSISICSLAIVIALKMEIDKNKIHDIGVGCLLHDIGLRYVTVKFEGREIEEFSETDKAEYKKHPIYGYTALQNESWISNLSKSIILYHHERLDGSGFPLKTSDIPLECQIVTVCDTFDEMICGIACRRSKVHEAIEYLKNFKEKGLNGRIVDIFLGFTAVYPAGTHIITNEGETGIVVSQNKDFHDRPVIRIIKDKYGASIKEGKTLDLVKIHNVFIEKVID